MTTALFSSSLQSELVGEYDEADGLAFFRGIPYATVKKRWTHSRVRHSLPGKFNATKFGPRCVQEDGEVLVSGGSNDPTPGDDEFDCLNMNITVPKECLSHSEHGGKQTKVPVMFWIHGGGFKYGANSVARYRPHKICAMARQAGQPVVLVQIGYRLGALGFAASNDLAQEQAQDSPMQGTGGQDRHVGNYGFIDQRNALRWVQDHISDFGGDPDNVTAFGISAGSASVHYHILTGDPMFDRAICMSGSAPTLGPLPFQRYENAWQELCKKVGLQEATPNARLARLRAMKPLEILGSYSTAAMGPMGDGIVLPKSWNFDQANPTRCRSLIIGDTNVEGIILDGFAKRLKPSQFQKIVHTVLSRQDADEFFSIFKFSGHDDQPWEQYRDSMRRFLSVMMFQFPNLRIAETFNAANGGASFLYHFEEPSPFPGPTFGVSYHGQCALYMYCVENDSLPIESRHVAESMAKMWMAFAHGVQPWEKYSGSGQFMRFGPHGEVGLKDQSTDECRDYGYVNWLKEHFEPVKELTQILLNGE